MPPLVETLIEDDRWRGIDLEGIAQEAARATLKALDLPAEGFEISLLACDDVRIAVLNEAFRGKAGPTNVLSWPSAERGAPDAGEMPALPQAGEAELGDIAIAFETCEAEARAAGRSLEHHMSHLIVHGVLHLLGFDHARDGDATLMESREIGILAQLGVANPYETQGA